MIEPKCKTCGSLLPDVCGWIDFGKKTQRTCSDKFHKRLKFPEWSSSDYVKYYPGERKHAFQWTGPENDPPGASTAEGRELLVDAIDHFLDHLKESIDL